MHAEAAARHQTSSLLSYLEPFDGCELPGLVHGLQAHHHAIVGVHVYHRLDHQQRVRDLIEEKKQHVSKFVGLDTRHQQPAPFDRAGGRNRTTLDMNYPRVTIALGFKIVRRAW